MICLTEISLFNEAKRKLERESYCRTVVGQAPG